MQIDMHHSLVYVLARLAGFSHAQSDVIAYSSQYVDDATNAGTVYFDNQARFFRLSSAHKTLNYRNRAALAKSRCWIPFHFLPANQTYPELSPHVPEYVQRLICQPHSAIAQRMVEHCIADAASPHALHRLGITLHTYADTWSHRGFAGIDHEINAVTDILDGQGRPSPEMKQYVASFYGQSPFERWKDKVISLVSKSVHPVGHGAVLGFPDRPYLHWKYRDFRGRLVDRDNPSDFLAAADHMFSVLAMFKSRHYDSQAWQAVPKPDRQVIETLIREVELPDGRERHYSWLRAIAEGRFSFGSATLHYQPKGSGSWKHLALGTTAAVDATNEVFPFKQEFLSSHWKLFHDALLHHQHTILHEILPEASLCAA